MNMMPSRDFGAAQDYFTAELDETFATSASAGNTTPFSVKVESEVEEKRALTPRPVSAPPAPSRE